MTKKQLYKRRVGTVENKLALIDDKNSKEYKAWKFFQRLVLSLGADGVSSDESSAAEANERNKAQVKTMRWRNNAELEMQAIDDEGMLNKDLRDARGAQSMTRYREGKPIYSTRGPPVGLPETLYDGEWMEDIKSSNPRFHEHKFYTSEEKFTWIGWQTKHCTKTGRTVTEEM